MAPMTAAARSAAAVKANETRRLNKGRPQIVKRAKPMPKLAPLTPIKLPKAPQPVTMADMMVRTVVMVLTTNRIGNRRKVDPESLNITDVHTQEEVNKEWLGVTRKLMDAPELKTIASIGNKAKAFVLSRSLPSLIKTGVYLLPNEFTDPVDAKLKEFEAEMRPHIESLARKLPEYKKEAALQPQFNEDQWPTADMIRSAFRISWRFLRIDSAEGLSKKLYEEECRKAAAQGEELRHNIQQLLRAEFAAKVDHFIERLTPDGDGKTRKVQEGFIEKFREFNATFNPRDITNDAKMRVLVGKAEFLLQNADTEGIQTNEQWREYMKHGFETIKTLLDPMITDKPHRSIRLED
jgi:hypothetical protein